LRALEPHFVERIWGRTNLSPWFSPEEKPEAGPLRIGEAWFQVSPDHPLLLKFLFTSQKLSVQVHPDDDLARKWESCRGKTEMWHILDAEAGASVALGLKQPIAPEEFRRRLEDGTADDLLDWTPVQVGDTYLISAGVVHALGAGLVICEIQQNSDVTYRLYDYGRGRELHLDKGLGAARLDAKGLQNSFPLRCRYFQVEELRTEGPEELEMVAHSFLVAVQGSGTINDSEFRAGNVLYFEETEAAVLMPDSPMRVLAVRSGD
jgi:mannose-6-phosphate isomerase